MTKLNNWQPKLSFKHKQFAILQIANLGPSPSGKAADSDSAIVGSNPTGPTIFLKRCWMKLTSKSKTEYQTIEDCSLALNNSAQNHHLIYNNSCRFSDYDLEKYKNDIREQGIESTWTQICNFVLQNPKNLSIFLHPKNFAELYEIGLALQDKNSKKQSGQYYTPKDVSIVMSTWLLKQSGENICDVGCGTGNLILTYLELLGKNKTIKLIKEGRLHLYDFDKIALLICRTSIAFLYGTELFYHVNSHHCDFLDKDIFLPENSKVISNPPYSQIKNIPLNWKLTKVLNETKEYYSCFMEKIFTQAVGAVVISPFTFLSGEKYFSLRELMCENGNGFIVNFDNVPGNIFNGRKHGTFNTNTANSVRASITVFEKHDSLKGFRISPLIRFKNSERNRMLDLGLLTKLLPETRQTVSETNRKFKKVSKELMPIFDKYLEKSNYSLRDFLEDKPTEYLIDMPNTCRYFTTASSKKLNRSGSFLFYLKDPKVYDFVYCLINSSFTYWWWRVYDGGITYPVNLLKSLPVPFNLLKEQDFIWFKETTAYLKENENSYLIQKMNAGSIQENIKFPEKIRKRINIKILELLKFNKADADKLTQVHANCFFDNDSD